MASLFFWKIKNRRCTGLLPPCHPCRIRFIDALCVAEYHPQTRMALEFRTNHTPLVAPGGMECFARDMTVTISADVTLAAAQAKLAEFNQWLPIAGDIQTAV